ncbi:MAG: response regulator [Opitutaceae bacterium]
MSQQSISRRLLFNVIGPIILLVVIVVGWMNYTNVRQYSEGLEQAQGAVEELARHGHYEPEELSVLRDQLVDQTRSDLYRGIGFSVFILALAIVISFFAMKSLRSSLNRNFEILKQRVDAAGESADSQIDGCDFEEFEAVATFLESSIRKQSVIRDEHEQVKAEMTRVNEDLSVRVITLEQEFQAALQTIKTVQSDHRELEADNQRLEQAVKQARNSEIRSDSPIPSQSKSVSLGTSPVEATRDSKEPGAKIGNRCPLKIVVAEDNAANQRVLMIMLRRLGWGAEFVNDGKQLLDFLKDSPVDLVFMDLQMPIMDGIEATARIREGAVGEHLKEVKIIALTANAMQGDEEHCLRSGMDAYVSKPLRLDILRLKIVELFGLVDDV